MENKKNEENYSIKHMSTCGLALFLFLTPFEYPLADLMKISPLRMVGILAMGLAILDVLMQRKLKLDYRILYIALWLLYGLITSFWALDDYRYQSYYSIYLNNALMFLLFSAVPYTKHEAGVVKKAMILGVGALLLYMAFVPGAVVYSDYQSRLTLNTGSGGIDQNYLAALMVVSFGIVFYHYCNTNQKLIHKILSISFCVAIAYYVVLTGSRSGLIALVMIVFVSVNTSWRVRLLIGIPIVVLLLVVLPIIARYIPKELLERFSLSALTGREVESGTRLVIWKKAVSSLGIIEWIFGYGVGASQTVVGDVLSGGRDMAIHNHYLAMIVEVGLIGFLLINIPIIKMEIVLLKKDKSVAVAFIGIMLIAMFIDVVITKFFWSAMILLSVCSSAHGNIDFEGSEYNYCDG